MACERVNKLRSPSKWLASTEIEFGSLAIVQAPLDHPIPSINLIIIFRRKYNFYSYIWIEINLIIVIFNLQLLYCSLIDGKRKRDKWCALLVCPIQLF